MNVSLYLIDKNEVIIKENNKTDKFFFFLDYRKVVSVDSSYLVISTLR